jgi:hypothetical protein
VQLRESGDEREANARPRRVARRRWSLPERLEHGFVEIHRHPGPVILDGDEDAPVLRPRPNPDVCSLRRMTDGVREEVLDDAFDLRPIDGKRHRLDIKGEVPALGDVGVRREIPHQGADVGVLPVGLEDAAREPVKIQQVGDHLVELAGVLRDPGRHITDLLLVQLHIVAGEREGQAEDRSQRCPKVVGDGLQERVLQFVESPKTLG